MLAHFESTVLTILWRLETVLVSSLIVIMQGLVELVASYLFLKISLKASVIGNMEPLSKITQLLSFDL